MAAGPVQDEGTTPHTIHWPRAVVVASRSGSRDTVRTLTTTTWTMTRMMGMRMRRMTMRMRMARRAAVLMDRTWMIIVAGIVMEDWRGIGDAGVIGRWQKTVVLGRGVVVVVIINCLVGVIVGVGHCRLGKPPWSIIIIVGQRMGKGSRHRSSSIRAGVNVDTSRIRRSGVAVVIEVMGVPPMEEGEVMPMEMRR